MDAGQEVVFRTIMEWLWVALMKKVGDYKSPLALPRPTASLSDGDFFCHYHHILIRHLPRLYLALRRVQG